MAKLEQAYCLRHDKANPESCSETTKGSIKKVSRQYYLSRKTYLFCREYSLKRSLFLGGTVPTGLINA
jgi:hypothetical protein